MTSPGGYEEAFREVGAALNTGGDTSDGTIRTLRGTGTASGRVSTHTGRAAELGMLEPPHCPWCHHGSSAISRLPDSA